jgi:hypothetical protein
MKPSCSIAPQRRVAICSIRRTLASTGRSLADGEQAADQSSRHTNWALYLHRQASPKDHWTRLPPTGMDRRQETNVPGVAGDAGCGALAVVAATLGCWSGAWESPCTIPANVIDRYLTAPRPRAG